MHLYILRIGGAIGLMLAVLSASAAPTVAETFRYYPVSASTTRQLSRALDKASPVRDNGRIFYAYTRTGVRWRFWWQQDSRGCRIDRVSTSVDVTYTLPELVAATPEVTQLWEQWYPKLLQHEFGHKDLAIATANNIEAAIRSMPAQSDCEELQRQANALGQQFIERLDGQAIAYDVQTTNGSTQGADLQLYLPSD